MICSIDTAFKLDITVVIIIATSGIAIVGTTAKMTESIVVTRSLRGWNTIVETGPIYPSGGSKLGAGPESSFSSLSFSCGYQNRACFDIL